MIGILCATRREAAPLIERLKAESMTEERPRAWSFALADGRRGVLAVSGMGPTKAAAATEKLVVDHGAKEILNVGICGALRDDLPVTSLCWINLATATTRPDEPWPAREAPALPPWNSLPARRLVTSPTPVFSRAKRSELSALGDVVDMEGAAVAKVATQHARPWTMLKGISDHADGKGPAVLLQNIDSLSARLAQLVVDGLTHGGGTGTTVEE
jgi:adenosylhomocysteine nucleosidase